MNIMKRVAAGALMAVLLAGTSHAAKWKELVFNEDINMGLAELSQYCMLHDITVADVLWANSIESADIKPGQSVYLPVSQADMLAIWQHKGAWQPTALVPVTSAAAAKRVMDSEPAPAKTVSAPETTPAMIPATKVEAVTESPAPEVTATPEPVQAKSIIPEVKAEPLPTPKKKSYTDSAMAKLRAEVNASPAPEIAQAKSIIPEVKAEPLPTTPKKKSPAPEMKVVKMPEPKLPAKTTKAKKESPAKVISNTAKPDKILAGKKSTTKNEPGGIMDPIIILSPNGDPSKGPMRLVISGDKVEVVQLPQGATPKRPSLSDLDYTLGVGQSYLPHYNMTAKPRKDPFIINMGNLAGKMLWPVDGKVSSPFGKWRGKHKHQGIDIPMPAGTPIRAARNGVVSRTGNNSTMGFRGYGNFVIMDHGDGLQTFYAHCLSVAVVQGQRVMQGQVIGYVGSTGRSTGNHLHFEVRVNNTKVDPMRFLAGNTHLASNK